MLAVKLSNIDKPRLCPECRSFNECGVRKDWPRIPRGLTLHSSLRWLFKLEVSVSSWKYKSVKTLKKTNNNLWSKRSEHSFRIDKWLNPTTRPQPVKMDFIKKFYPKQNDIQTFKVDPQGFRKTINENPPTSIFFVNPPEGSKHGQNCIESKKNNTSYYKNLLLTQLSASEIFPAAILKYILETCSQKPRLEKKSYLGYGTSEKKFACRKLGQQ